jgi:hypothetical protein
MTTPPQQCGAAFTAAVGQLANQMPPDPLH